MNYTFPLIKHIDQVREAIQGKPEFFEADKGEYIVFNYMVAMEDSFPLVKTAGGSAKMRAEAEFKKSLLRECRGLIFDKSGQVLSRRFHKFFNINERLETLHEKIDWNKKFHILDKLDGSMITPLMLPSGLRWATKMGVTDISEKCEQFVTANYVKFAKDCYDAKITPIFEYMSPYNRVVIDYGQEQLVLLAIRNNLTGVYFSPEALKLSAEEYSIPYLQPLGTTLEQLMENVSSSVGVEGYVITFDDGHRLKLKTEWYSNLHKAKENLLFEKNVIKIILEEKLDDLLPHLLENDRKNLLNFQKQLIDNIDLAHFMCDEILYKSKKHLSKKDFALKVAPTLEPFIRNICFACWDETESKNIRKLIIENILKRCNSQTNVDSIRDIIGCKWKVGQE